LAEKRKLPTSRKYTNGQQPILLLFMADGRDGALQQQLKLFTKNRVLTYEEKNSVRLEKGFFDKLIF